MLWQFWNMFAASIQGPALRRVFLEVILEQFVDASAAFPRLNFRVIHTTSSFGECSTSGPPHLYAG